MNEDKINISCRIPNEVVTIQYSGQTESVLKQMFDDLRLYRTHEAIKHFHNELEDYIGHGRFLNYTFKKSPEHVAISPIPVGQLIDDLSQLVPKSYDHVPFIEFQILSMQAQ